jgi:hypothetical protein
MFIDNVHNAIDEDYRPRLHLLSIAFRYGIIIAR